MNDFYFPNDPIDRVDGKLKVTGAARYAADQALPPKATAYGYLVGSTVAKGRIKTIDTAKALRAPGVLGVITHLNAPKLPGYQTGKDPSKPPTGGGPLRIFQSDEIFYYDQPIALVIADTFERVKYAARLITATFEKGAHATDLEANEGKAFTPSGPRFEDYKRGNGDAYAQSQVKFEAEYHQPIEVHNPMEPGSIIARWEGDKVTLWTKTQGVESTKRTVQDAFRIPAEGITVHGEHIGGAFGMALRTWPYEIAALIGAREVKRPLKLMLHREQMMTNVGYRPATTQVIRLGATPDGQLLSLHHEATGNTSTYQEFTEGTVNISRFLYACPNVTTRYRIVPLDLVTPIWMRGPGEATGSFALESAMDELAHELKLDPIELRRRNHADTDPERNLPWSSKYLRECYDLGAERIGWSDRKMQPGTNRDGDWLIGYGMGTGSFGAGRGSATVRARMDGQGRLLLQSSVNDMGPGTATMMTAVASDVMGMPAQRIGVQMGSTDLPPGPTQGGSTVTSTVGSAVHEACTALKGEIAALASKEGSPLHTANVHSVKAEDLLFSETGVSLRSNPSVSATWAQLLGDKGVEVTKESRGERKPFSSYSFSVHFVKLRVHPATGRIRLDRIVSTADCGAIVSPKTAESQLIGGAVGGVGMALMEELVIDHRFGRPVNNNFADYHVPVHADIPPVEVIFVNKKDPHTNPMGSKGLGEISLVGMAPAIANAVFNATGKRIRTLPITPDKLL